jgi:formylmethanofuran dehydrogenase subunit E
MNASDLDRILEISAREHPHLCPRQVLGARLGLAGLAALGFAEPPPGKRLLVILETDGCFLDGVAAATGCTPGHRTLRVEDYGKTAGVFADTASGRTLRVAPRTDLRARAAVHSPDLPRYQGQLQAYRTMADGDLFTVAEVALRIPVTEIVSRPRVRVDCADCGEEIINERAVARGGKSLCRTCALGGYYAAAPEPCGLP